MFQTTFIGQFRSVNWESTFCLFANRACIDNMWGEPLKSVTGFKVRFLPFISQNCSRRFTSCGQEQTHRAIFLTQAVRIHNIKTFILF